MCTIVIYVSTPKRTRFEETMIIHALSRCFGMFGSRNYIVSNLYDEISVGLWSQESFSDQQGTNGTGQHRLKADDSGEIGLSNFLCLQNGPLDLQSNDVLWLRLLHKRPLIIHEQPSQEDF